ncbi:MAG: hypothetical protein AAB456_03380 [Patescibacteria group bacterium]
MVLKGSLVDLGGVAGALRIEGNREYIFAYAAAAETVGKVRVITFDGDEETNPTASAPATQTTVYQLVGVATKTTTAAGFLWYQIKGDAEALVEGTTNVAKDDFLQVLNAETSFKKDGASITTEACAIAQEAQTADSSVLTNVYLFGERVFIAAS